MSKAKTLGIRLDPSVYDQVAKLAATDKVTPTEYARELIMKGLDITLIDKQKELFSVLVQSAVTQALKPVENRLATISSKSALSSGTSTWMTMMLFNRVLNMDEETVMEYYSDAKKQAYKFLRKKGDQDEGVEE